eukprot:gnl/Chilomastix_cuspidata/3926.p2 GENE.gnl/Chilomastix_cuspidata/3926~~gnl/Chilomastix_cuspidata/3926.p2  ORF type:complete len:389 (+),score=173.70 gnl/Chilomastix_cuspidata/3926:110-1276(+)
MFPDSFGAREQGDPGEARPPHTEFAGGRTPPDYTHRFGRPSRPIVSPHVYSPILLSPPGPVSSSTSLDESYYADRDVYSTLGYSGALASHTPGAAPGTSKTLADLIREGKIAHVGAVGAELDAARASPAGARGHARTVSLDIEEPELQRAGTPKSPWAAPAQPDAARPPKPPRVAVKKKPQKKKKRSKKKRRKAGASRPLSPQPMTACAVAAPTPAAFHDEHDPSIARPEPRPGVISIDQRLGAIRAEIARFGELSRSIARVPLPPASTRSGRTMSSVDDPRNELMSMSVSLRRSINEVIVSLGAQPHSTMSISGSSASDSAFSQFQELPRLSSVQRRRIIKNLELEGDLREAVKVLLSSSAYVSWLSLWFKRYQKDQNGGRARAPPQ